MTHGMNDRLVEQIGKGNITWASDLAHSDGHPAGIARIHPKEFGRLPGEVVDMMMLNEDRHRTVQKPSANGLIHPSKRQNA